MSLLRHWTVDEHGEWSRVAKPPVRLDTRHLARHARRAIAERLKYPAPEALRAVERKGDAVILRFNSGGNALAVESYIRQWGYRAEWAGVNPDGYGAAVKVTLRPEPAPVLRDMQGGK